MIQEAKRLFARWQRNQALAEQRRTRARVFARKLAKDLALADPSVKMIVGFGSTFESWRSYRLDSDIDLGLYGGNWSLLWSLVPESEFAVSLVELELQPESFSEQVQMHGEILYEKQ